MLVYFVLTILILTRKLLVDPEEFLAFVHHADETAEARVFGFEQPIATLLFPRTFQRSVPSIDGGRRYIRHRRGAGKSGQRSGRGRGQVSTGGG